MPDKICEHWHFDISNMLQSCGTSLKMASPAQSSWCAGRVQDNLWSTGQSGTESWWALTSQALIRLNMDRNFVHLKIQYITLQMYCLWHCKENLFWLFSWHEHRNCKDSLLALCYVHAFWHVQANTHIWKPCYEKARSLCMHTQHNTHSLGKGDWSRERE